ncbi:pyridoxal phosphate-dependent transferase [Entophlyctis helioformis]|nr:pyridoxal phosphate-dependent transferase [Entophlyctis helioformis]
MPFKQGDVTLFPTDERPDWVSFEFGAPGADLLPSALFAQAAAHRFAQPDAHNSLQYGPILGDLRFRIELAKFLTRQYGGSVPVQPESLCITNGASQSFSNIITMFTDAQTVIFIENPTYFLAIRVLEDHGIQRKDLVAIPVDDHGIQVDCLRRELESRCPSPRQSQPQPSGPGFAPKRFPFMLYLVPTFSNPTGTTLSTDRRRDLAALARDHDMLIVCDDVYQLLPFTADPIPDRLVSFDSSLASQPSRNGSPQERFGHIISNGSFSKIVAPGLRLGWVEAAPGIITQLDKSGLLFSGGCPNHVTSTIMLLALELGLVDKHLQRLRTVYASRCAALCQALAKGLDVGGDNSMASFLVPTGGFFVWVKLTRLPPSVTTLDVREYLVACDEADKGHKDRPKMRSTDKAVTPERVSMTPGNAFSTDQTHGSWFRVSFAMYDEERLVQGAERLCRVLRQLCL